MLMEMDYTLKVNDTTYPNMLTTNLVTATDPYSCAAGSHGICVLTEWDEFKTLDFGAWLSEGLTSPHLLPLFVSYRQLARGGGGVFELLEGGAFRTRCASRPPRRGTQRDDERRPRSGAHYDRHEGARTATTMRHARR